MEKAIPRNLIRTLILNDGVKTTHARAKALAKIADSLVIKAKRGTLADRRLIFKFLPDEKLVAKLFKEIMPKLAEVKSGFVRIVKMGYRAGDGAKMAQVGWVNQASKYVDQTNKT